MRGFFLSIALLAWLPAAAGADPRFDGAWTASLCAKGASREAGECATFVLELMEKDGKLCGAHLFATPGAARLDEGMAPSVTADIVQATASGVAISHASGSAVRVPVELSLEGTQLRWRRLEAPDGASLLPEKATLTRSGKRTLFAPLFEQKLRAACTVVFNLAAPDAALPDAATASSKR